MAWTVTERWLRQYARGRAGWTRKQIEALGLTYPQQSGWMERIEGTTISDSARKLFEQLRRDRDAEKREHPQRERNRASTKRGAKNRVAHRKESRSDSNERGRAREHSETVWFGRHKDEPWSVVPERYLRWVVEEHGEPAAKAAARLELKRRGEFVGEPIPNEFLRDFTPVDETPPWEPLSELDREFREIVGFAGIS